LAAVGRRVEFLRPGAKHLTLDEPGFYEVRRDGEKAARRGAWP